MIRLPLTNVLDVNNSVINATGPASTAGGVANTFLLPQDCDNVVLKLEASVLAGGVSATLQTSDNGGATWFDVARTSIVSNTGGSVLAEWLNIPVGGFGFRPTAGVASVGTGTAVSILSVTGSSGASTLSQKDFSGLGMMSQYGRVFLRYTSAVTSILNERVQVFTNTQSGGR